MPGARRNQRRSPRCAYSDGRGRCRRNATAQLEGLPLCGRHAEQAAEHPTTREIISDWFADRVMGDPRLGPMVEQITERISIDDVIDRVVTRSSARGRQIRTARAQGRPVPRAEPDPEPLPIWARNIPRGPAPPPPPAPKTDPTVEARQILHFGPSEALDRPKIQARRKALAAMCHPDRGGDTRAMQQINQAADCLLAKFG